MKLINENPYRIAGLLAGSGAKEMVQQKSKLTKFVSIGKTVTSEYDFSFLPSIVRTEESVNKAFSDIQQNQDKVNYALFWFYRQ